MNRVHVAYRVLCMLIILIATLTACTSASPGAAPLPASPSAGTTVGGVASPTKVAALAADCQYGEPFVREFRSTPVPSGKWRYYDGMLYMLGLLHVSGNFQIYFP
ncbi:hypothetical protein [Roseiflexus sp.]